MILWFYDSMTQKICFLEEFTNLIVKKTPSIFVPNIKEKNVPNTLALKYSYEFRSSSILRNVKSDNTDLN